MRLPMSLGPPCSPRHRDRHGGFGPPHRAWPTGGSRPDVGGNVGANILKLAQSARASSDEEPCQNRCQARARPPRHPAQLPQPWRRFADRAGHARVALTALSAHRTRHLAPHTGGASGIMLLVLGAARVMATDGDATPRLCPVAPRRRAAAPPSHRDAAPPRHRATAAAAPPRRPSRRAAAPPSHRATEPSRAFEPQSH